MPRLSLILAAASAAAWGSSAEPKAADGLSFLMIGDWGGDSNSQPTTKGETCTASGMGKIASKLGASFVLALGDNFYESGVEEYNKDRLQSTFEDVFTDSSLDIPWHVVAGNHDHRGSVQEQIDFSKTSKRWNFPAMYYLLNYTLPSGKLAEFVMFDSVLTSGQSYYDHDTKEHIAATGPADAEAAAQQWSWIEDALAQSKADYLFTAAHYPVWSACAHGPTSDLVENLRPLMKRYSVTAHLSGHDHCLLHIQDGQSAHVLSGAGAQAWYRLSNTDKLGSGVELKWHLAEDNADDYSGGFAAMTLTDEGALVSYYGDDGTLLFTSETIPPRDRSATVTV